MQMESEGLVIAAYAQCDSSKAQGEPHPCDQGRLGI